MATFDVAKLLNKITQDIPGINTVLKALAKWDVSALSDVPDGAMQATTDTNNRLTIKKKVSGSYTPVAKLMHDVDTVDGYHASTGATANTVAVRNAAGALPGNITGNAATADTAVALAAGAVVPVNQGGTGATTASQARVNLGAAGSADFTAHIAKQSSTTVEGHVKLTDSTSTTSSTVAASATAVKNLKDSLRVPLTEDTTFYVRSNGDDARDGLTEAKSLKTVDAAVALLSMYDPRDKKVIIDIGQGTFVIAKIIACAGYDHTNLFLQGAGVQKTFLQGASAPFNYRIYINASLSGVTCFSALNTSHVGATLAVRLHRGNGILRMNGRPLTSSWGRILLNGATMQFAPNAENPSHTFDALFTDCGEIICDAGTVFEAVNNPSFNIFATSGRGGVINFYTCTFTGTATGRKYLAYQGGVITGQAANYNLTSLLGNTNGISDGGAVIGIGATNEPTPNIIMRRDGAGRVRVADPVHDKDVVNKGYLDNSLLPVVNATPFPTPNTIIRRDGAGRVRVEAPVHGKDVVNKGYVDNLLGFKTQVVVFTVSGTYTAPFDAIGIITLVGGGGGGAADNKGGSHFGGGAGAVQRQTVQLSKSTQYPVIIGAGGAGGVTGANEGGGTGGESRFMDITAAGGVGGGSGAELADRTYGVRCLPSNFIGGGSTGTGSHGGHGGFIHGLGSLGVPIIGATSTEAGAAGVGYGAGGAGGGLRRHGGRGASGLCIIIAIPI